MSEGTPLPPPPPKNPDKTTDKGRHAPATGRPVGDPHRNDDVQQDGKPRRKNGRGPRERA